MLGAAACAAHATAAQAPAWQGYLEVQAQAGAGCEAGKTLPYRIALQALGSPTQADGLLVWGGMQTSELRPGADGQLALRMAGSRSIAGSVRLQADGSGLAGAWAETSDEGSCNFTRAQLRLQPAEPARQEALRACAGMLRALHGAQEQLRARHRRPEARAAAAPLLALARQPQGDCGAAASLAQVFVEAAEQLHAQREPTLAGELAHAATRLYLGLGAEQPEYAALSLALEGRIALRLGGMAQAQPRYDEALALLAAHGRSASGAASTIHNELGALHLRAGRTADALRSFARALQADEDRGAPALDRAEAMTNLAAALKQAGDADRALALFQRALALAEGAGTAAQPLAEIIREHLAALEQGPRERRIAVG